MMISTKFPQTDVTIRVAVLLLFSMTGFVMGSWAPRIPDLLVQLSISEHTFGFLLFTFGVGSLLFIPLSGYLIGLFGSATISRCLTILLAPMLLLLVWVNSPWNSCIIMFLFGGFIGGIDVGMNANASAVEKVLQRPIMCSCHACWNLGALLGAFFGGTILERWGRLAHGLESTFVALGILAISLPLLLNDSTNSAPTDSVPTQTTTLTFLKNVIPWLLGIIALFAMIPEGLILDWGAIYFRKYLGASISEAGYAYAIFSTSMMVMRFFGDRIREKWGAIATVRVGAIIAICGLLELCLINSKPAALVGFALMGLGLSNVFPIAVSAAAKLPGYSGAGLVLATGIGYSGILVAPPIIGFTIEQVGFHNVFLTTISLLVFILVFSHHTVHAETISSGQEAGTTSQGVGQ